MENGRFVVDSYFDAILNPDMPWGVSHMWVACLETSLFVIGGRERLASFARPQSCVLSQILSARSRPCRHRDAAADLAWRQQRQDLFQKQPAKGAAIEGHWNTNPSGKSAAWALLAWPDKAEQRNDWQVAIPGALSWLATGSLDGQVIGLKAFAPSDQPPLLPLIF